MSQDALAFSGKVAIVTGAAGGIGSAAARDLLKKGAKVVAVDIKTGDLDRLASDFAGNVTPLIADASTETGCQSYLDAALTSYGRVDLFVNNAGIMGPRVPLIEISESDFEKVFAVNVKGIFLGLRTVMRAMIKQGAGGAIVNTGSIGGIRVGKSRCCAYASSKAAVIALSCSAAIQAAPHNIRVNAVCPGHTDTGMVPHRPTIDGVNPFAGDPISRLGRPDEIARFISFLLSDDASYQTGGVYPIDGGQLLV